MTTKKIILSIFSIFLFAWIFSYSLVFAGWIWEITFVKSKNIILDSISLNENRVILYSRENARDFDIKWECWIFWKLVKSENNYHVFDLKLVDKTCDKSRIDVYFYLWNSFIKTRFNLITTKDYFNQFLDLNDSSLEKVILKLNKNITKLKKYEDYTLNSGIDYLDFLKKNRQLEEIKYTKNLIENILLKRKEKYKIPVFGWELSTKHSKLPNAWRPYRSHYTDWIHHGFDFDAPLHSTAISLDDWIVVRVVKGFKFSDLSEIEYWNNLSDEIKTKNLDILRWNQVWIKTMKWDIAFYSHLENVFDNVEEWTILTKWEPIWTVWITWVPDKSYTDYHLHIPIHKNPYKWNNYSFDDIMNWPWYFKWESVKYILENQGNIFEK